jgi:GNAT superfamily N-acetyltransferase
VSIIRPLTIENMGHLDALFSCTPSSDHCRCMWFLKSVKAFHADGGLGNWRDLVGLAKSSELPLGLLAYNGDTPVGWCATGPRSRYIRATATPTYRGRDPDEDKAVWLVPCFFIHPAARGQGLTTKLLEAAVELARIRGASAIEAFPYTSAKRRGGDTQVGFASVFAALGFQTIRNPSPTRSLMRLNL